MNIHISALPLALIATLFFLTPSSLSKAKVAESTSTAIGKVKTQFSCKRAETIKFNKTKYKKLSLDDRVLVDAQYNQCEIDKKRAQAKKDGTAEPEDQIGLVANPVRTKGTNTVFYGRIKKKDLENAEKNCAGAGRAAGITLVVVGAATGVDETGRLGSAVFEYSGVSCSALTQNVAQGNLMVFLGPEKIVEAAVADKIRQEILNKVPFLSNADKKNVEKILRDAAAPPSVVVTKKEVQIGVAGQKIKLRAPSCCKF